MNCLFCGSEMWVEAQVGLRHYRHYKCYSYQCMIGNDFPRYICLVDTDDKICFQEYGAHNFYAKISDEGTVIHRLSSCLLLEGVSIPESLWLNPTNLEPTLDKVRGMHYIMWNG